MLIEVIGFCFWLIQSGMRTNIYVSDLFTYIIKHICKSIMQDV